MNEDDQVLLEVRNLTKKFGELKAVDDVSFQLHQGEMVGLIGPNGAGKTTIFNCVTGVYPVDKGNIFFKGREITKRKSWQIRRLGISRTFQASKLLINLSVYDNVFMGALPMQKGKIINAVFRRARFKQELYSTMERTNQLAKLFNENLIDKGFSQVKELSQIDRRRLEVMRAMMMNVDLLLLDEPTAGMTREESIEFLGDIAKIRESYPNMALAIVEHDMTVIEGTTDRVIFFNYGRKIIEGSFAEISKNEEVKEAYLGK